MPNIYTNIAVNSGIHPSIGVGFGGTEIASSGDLLQEDGTSLFVLENGSGVIILQ